MILISVTHCELKKAVLSLWSAQTVVFLFFFIFIISVFLQSVNPNL